MRDFRGEFLAEFCIVGYFNSIYLNYFGKVIAHFSAGRECGREPGSVVRDRSDGRKEIIQSELVKFPGCSIFGYYRIYEDHFSVPLYFIKDGNTRNSSMNDIYFRKSFSQSLRYPESCSVIRKDRITETEYQRVSLDQLPSECFHDIP